MPDFGRWTPGGDEPTLNEVNRTDRFLDALAAEEPVYSGEPGEAELAYLLAGWRDDVRTPRGAAVTQRDAEAALQSGATSRRRGRMSTAVIGSAAAAVLGLGGFGAVVYSAAPGDALYGVRTMLFGDQRTARDDQVVLAAQTEFAEVQELIDQQQWDTAHARLETLTTTVATVHDAQRQKDLVDQWQQLSVKVQNRNPNATVPPDAPPVVLPEPPSDSPLPEIVNEPGTTTSPTTTTSPSMSDTTTSPTSETPGTTATPTSETSEPTTTSPGSTTTSPSAELPPGWDQPTTTTAPTTTAPTTPPGSTTTPETTPPSDTTQTTVTVNPTSRSAPGWGGGGSGYGEWPTLPTTAGTPQDPGTVTAPETTSPVIQLPQRGR